MGTKVSESARAKEALRYEAASIASTTPLDPAKPLSSQLDRTASTFAADPVLTSLAQLAAVRLNATGAFISVFDLKHQHVLAQATQSSRISPRDGVPRQCQLLGAAIPRSSSFCEHVLLEADGVQPPSEELPVSVISDITTCPPSSSRPAGIVGLPETRFYAAVPIRSPRGLNIGCLTVYHSLSRDEVQPHELLCLRDISFVVTTHLQSKQAQSDLRRSERMVRGLGSFVEGATSMSLDLFDSNLSSFQVKGAEGALNPPIPQGFQSPTDLSPMSETDPDFGISSNGYSQLLGEDSVSPPAQDGRAFRMTLPQTFPFVPPDSQSSKPRTVVHLPSRPANGDAETSTDRTNSANSNQVSYHYPLFSRAANIIRESLEVEGVIFVDATSTTFGGLIGIDDNSDASTPASFSGHSSSEESLIHSQKEDREHYCNLFGYSTSASSSLSSDNRTSHVPNILEKFLRALLRRYPEGKIFFGIDGSVGYSGDSSGSESTIRVSDEPLTRVSSYEQSPTARPWSRQNEIATLRKIFPGVTSVMIVPLWDNAKQRWCAGGFVWTCTPARVFTPKGDLSYLQAFSMSILAELGRLETSIMERSKTDILGSLSHELRSPLHGIIAAVDLLHDTSLDAFQSDVTHSMESCGRVLLDVLNHLLDYSKVNTLLRDARTSKRSPRKKFGQRNDSPLRHSRPASTYTQVDQLLEESIDSVFAGHIYQKLSIAQLGRRPNDPVDSRTLRRADTIDAIESFGHRSGHSGNMNIQLGDVIVLVDVDPSVSWYLKAQPGAFRRIILNIVGNSLRYTTQGHILVTLRQEKNLSRKSHPLARNLQLTVTDTGKGIGSDFMKYRLFTPFSQEDQLSTGTGLGLSLVKKIVRTLEGSITVESEVGVGTCVQVTIPMPKPKDEVSVDSARDRNTSLSGLRISLVGLDKKPLETLFAPTNNPLLSESELMQRVCAEWLGLQIVRLDDDEYRPDLIICGESEMDQLLKDDGRGRLSAPILVICRDAVNAHLHNKSFMSDTKHRILEFISQPIGPRKLSKSLEVALERWAKAADTDLHNTDPGTPVLYPSTFPLASPLDASGLHGPPVEQKVEPGMPEPGSVSLDASNTAEATKPQDTPSSEALEPNGVQPTSNSAITHHVRSLHEHNSIPEICPAIQEKEILLVDDNLINLRILVAYMKKANRPFQTASNGLEALQAFTANPSGFSCILMDLSMPVMDGLEAARRIRSHERSQDNKSSSSSVTIIALTGLASSNTQQEAFACGIDLYLTKPVKLKELARILAERRL